MNMKFNKEIDAFSTVLNRIVFWRNDGQLYKGYIREVHIRADKSILFKVERVQYKTLHYLSLSDYGSVWDFTVSGVRQDSNNLWNWEEVL